MEELRGAWIPNHSEVLFFNRNTKNPDPEVPHVTKHEVLPAHPTVQQAALLVGVYSKLRAPDFLTFSTSVRV